MKPVRALVFILSADTSADGSQGLPQDWVLGRITTSISFHVEDMTLRPDHVLRSDFSVQCLFKKLLVESYL